jgi:hypothetical protein
VLAYLRSRSNLRLNKIALWGDSFVPANPEHLYLDEIEHESGPQIQYRAEPIGAHLALLAALFETDIHAVAARGGLNSYLSVLDSPFTYTPIDVTVFGILKAGDITDVAAALAPRPLLLEGLVSGRNVPRAQSDLEREFTVVRDSYRNRTAAQSLAVRPAAGDVASWLAARLR